MKLVGKVPVETLDEERLTNIERRLVVAVSEMTQHPMRAPRRLLAFAGVGLARLPVDQFVDLGAAIAGVVALGAAREILVHSKRRHACSRCSRNAGDTIDRLAACQ